MTEYRRRKDKDTWHWCKNCSNYPVYDYVPKETTTRPTTGELCDECLAKERDNRCSK